MLHGHGDKLTNVALPQVFEVGKSLLERLSECENLLSRLAKFRFRSRTKLQSGGELRGAENGMRQFFGFLCDLSCHEDACEGDDPRVSLAQIVAVESQFREVN